MEQGSVDGITPALSNIALALLAEVVNRFDENGKYDGDHYEPQDKVFPRSLVPITGEKDSSGEEKPPRITPQAFSKESV